MNKHDYDKLFEVRLRALGFAVLGLQRFAADSVDGGPRLIEVRFKLDADGGTSTLAVCKAVGDDGAVVAFVGGLELADVVLALAKKLEGGSLKWREDRPWQG